MNFVNEIHRRIYEIAKYNTTLANSLNYSINETCFVKTKNFKIYLYNDQASHGFMVTTKETNDLVLSISSDQRYVTIVPNDAQWVKEFEEVEELLKWELNTAKYYELQLETVARKIYEHIK